VYPVCTGGKNASPSENFLDVQAYMEHMNWLRVFQIRLTSCSMRRNLLHARPGHPRRPGQKMRRSPTFPSCIRSGVPHLFLTAFLSYATVSLPNRQGETLLRHGKLATSSSSLRADGGVREYPKCPHFTCYRISRPTSRVVFMSATLTYSRENSAPHYNWRVTQNRAQYRFRLRHARLT
jgi:hypothetical protein